MKFAAYIIGLIAAVLISAAFAHGNEPTWAIPGICGFALVFVGFFVLVEGD